jgi:mono/diheme cytochrome c family protein
MAFSPPLRLAVLALLAGPALPLCAQETPITPLHHDLAARTFQAACSACHYRGEGKLPFGTRGPVADRSPDELVQFILFGKAPEDDEGGMPAFGAALTDADVARVVIWLRATSKPDAPWPDVPASVAQMRTSGAREE